MDGLKIVTIGGGSSYTPELIEGFIKRIDTLPVREIWLVDIEEGKEKLEIVTNLARRMVKKAGVDIKIYSTLDRREALKDADFVTTQLRVGQLDARELDERIPLSHKMLGQETNGAAGMFKAFRTIPVILDIAKDIEELCSDAWLINFTNPAGMVTEALIRYSNLTKVIGLCNVPIHLEKSIAKALEVDENRIQMTFAGLNHMVYGLEVLLDGNIVTDKVIDIMTDKEKQIESVKNISDVVFEKEFLKALNVIPCPYHNYYYKKDIMLKEELEQFKTNTVRAQIVKEVEKELFELYKDENLDVKPEQLEKRGGAYYSDAACRLIDSIYNDKRDIQTVDIRNNGAIYGIDENSCVEVSAIITKKGPIPLNIGKLPIQINGLIQQIKTFEMLTVESAVTGDYEKAVLALTVNPLTPNDEVAKVVVDELMQAHKKYLPQFFKN